MNFQHTEYTKGEAQICSIYTSFTAHFFTTGRQSRDVCPHQGIWLHTESARLLQREIGQIMLESYSANVLLTALPDKLCIVHTEPEH